MGVHQEWGEISRNFFIIYPVFISLFLCQCCLVTINVDSPSEKILDCLWASSKSRWLSIRPVHRNLWISWRGEPAVLLVTYMKAIGTRRRKKSSLEEPWNIVFTQFVQRFPPLPLIFLNFIFLFVGFIHLSLLQHPKRKPKSSHIHESMLFSWTSRRQIKT